MRFKNICFILILSIMVAPVYSETTCIDVTKVEQIVTTAVQQAVAEAVKAERLKYVQMEESYKLLLVDKDAEIAKKDVIIANDLIIISNLKSDKLDLQKKLITTNLAIGGSTFLVGFIGGALTFQLKLR